MLAAMAAVGRSMMGDGRRSLERMTSVQTSGEGSGVGGGGRRVGNSFVFFLFLSFSFSLFLYFVLLHPPSHSIRLYTTPASTLLFPRKRGDAHGQRPLERRLCLGSPPAGCGGCVIIEKKAVLKSETRRERERGRRRERAKGERRDAKMSEREKREREGVEGVSFRSALCSFFLSSVDINVH